MPTLHAAQAAKILVGAYDLSPFFTDANAECSVAMVDTTTFGATSKTRQSTTQDGTVKASGYYDGAIGAVDEAFQAALAGSDQAFTFAQLGDTAGNPALLGALQESKYTTKLAVGALVATEGEWVTQGGAYVPLAWGTVHRALTAITTTANGASQDGGAATTTGWRATLHVTAKSGTTPTLDVKLQDSADNSTFADVTGGAFTQRTAAGSQILYSASGATLRRYVRLVYTVAGTSPSFTVAAAVARQ